MYYIEFYVVFILGDEIRFNFSDFIRFSIIMVG